MSKTTKHIVITVIVLLLTVALFEYTDIDIVVQDYLYDFSSSHWLLDRDETISKLIFYDGIKTLIIISVLLMITGAFLFRHSHYIQNHKAGITIVVLSALLVPLVIGSLKAVTNIPCPRDLQHYGGTYPHITLLTPYPEDFYQEKNIRCYPAGHASGGFALLSLFFLIRRKRNRMIAVAAVLSTGWAMGIYKTLIGDHFLSHTAVTMILAWLIILIVAKSVYRYMGRNSKDLVS